MRKRASGVAVLLAVVVLPGCSAPAAPYFESLPVSVQPGEVFPLLTLYSGWWDKPAFAPGTAGLPLKVGLIRAETGEFIAGYDRPAGRQIAGADTAARPGWPPGTILAVDLSTGAVWDWFRVDGTGLPAPGFEDRVSAEQGFPPIKGSLPPGSFPHLPARRRHRRGDLPWHSTGGSTGQHRLRSRLVNSYRI